MSPETMQPDYVRDPARWGTAEIAEGHPPKRSEAVAAVWRKFATGIVHAESMECGHSMQEEIPDLVYDRFTAMFGG